MDQRKHPSPTAPWLAAVTIPFLTGATAWLWTDANTDTGSCATGSPIGIGIRGLLLLVILPPLGTALQGWRRRVVWIRVIASALASLLLASFSSGCPATLVGCPRLLLLTGVRHSSPSPSNRANSDSRGAAAGHREPRTEPRREAARNGQPSTYDNGAGPRIPRRCRLGSRTMRPSGSSSSASGSGSSSRRARASRCPAHFQLPATRAEISWLSLGVRP